MSRSRPLSYCLAFPGFGWCLTPSSRSVTYQVARCEVHIRDRTYYVQEAILYKMNELFRRFAHAAADKVGHPSTFLLGVLVIVAWAIAGPVFHYSDTWQLIINTGTTIVTFLMVFLIQNTQNRDALAMHLKLDELIRSSATSRDIMVGLETCTEEELAEISEEFAKIRERILARSETKNKTKAERPAGR